VRHKAIIFDLDGTLLNTLDDLADAMNGVLRERRFPIHPVDAYRYLVGNGAVALVSRALPPKVCTDQLQAECLAAFRDAYGRNWNVKTRLYDGVVAMLEALGERGTTMAVFTNKLQQFAELCVGEFLHSFDFAVVFGQREGVRQNRTRPGPWKSPSVSAFPQRISFIWGTVTST